MKKSINNNLKSLSLFMIMIFITAFMCACGNGDDDVVAPAYIKEGRFVDSAVEGLRYKTASQEGITDSKGTFKYADQETVSFFIGNIELGECSVKPVLTPVDLIEDADDTTDSGVVNIARLLITLDDDDNPDNGIFISRQVREKAKKVSQGFKLNFKSKDFESDAQRLVSDLTENREKGRGTVNLLDADNMGINLGDILLTERNINQIRFVLGSQSTVTAAGVSHPLKVPSGAVKILWNKKIIADELTEVLLDFDPVIYNSVVAFLTFPFVL